MTSVRNDLFDPTNALNRDRPAPAECTWHFFQCPFFLSPLPLASSLKCAILRPLVAKIGRGVVIKPRVNIHLPWKLEIGDFTWIGEEVFILNLEPVRIGSQCCISQRAFLCTGNHDYKRPEMPY